MRGMLLATAALALALVNAQSGAPQGSGSSANIPQRAVYPVPQSIQGNAASHPLPDVYPSAASQVQAVIDISDGQGGTLKGTVTVKPFEVEIELNPSAGFVYHPTVAKCADRGLKWHIHTNWDWSSPNRAEYGEDKCGVHITGGSYDPTIACSPMSDNKFCAHYYDDAYPASDPSNQNACVLGKADCPPISSETNCCTETFPCALGQGGCTKDADCFPGLKCQPGVGQYFAAKQADMSICVSNVEVDEHGNAVLDNQGNTIKSAGRPPSYACDAAAYAANPYQCEVGDMSGKFGLYDVAAPQKQSYRDYFGAAPESLYGMSIVFQCYTGEPVACAGLQTTLNTDELSFSAGQPVEDRMAVDLEDIGITGIMEIKKNKYEVMYNVQQKHSAIRAINDTCLLFGIKYRIHAKWEDDSNISLFGSDCTQEVTGGTWDPTLACSPESNNGNCKTHSGGAGCVKGGSTSNNDAGYLCDYDHDPYSCEVGDLSGKFGDLAVAFDVIHTDWIEDPFLPPHSELEGRSVVFYCSDDSVAFCGRIQNLVTNSPTAPPTTPFPTVAPTYPSYKMFGGWFAPIIVFWCLFCLCAVYCALYRPECYDPNNQFGNAGQLADAVEVGAVEPATLDESMNQDRSYEQNEDPQPAATAPPAEPTLEMGPAGDVEGGTEAKAQLEPTESIADTSKEVTDAQEVQDPEDAPAKSGADDEGSDLLRQWDNAKDTFDASAVTPAADLEA